MTTTDTDGVPVIEPSISSRGGRPKSPLIILLCMAGMLAIIGGLYAWMHHSSPEASASVTVRPADSRPALHQAASALAVPTTPTPQAVVPPNKVNTPLADVVQTKSRNTIGGQPRREQIASQPSKLERRQALPPADNRVLQMRKTFEQNGWSVYWLRSKNEVSAWKSEGKTGYEVRLVPGARYATVLKTGGRNIILKRWTVSLPSRPVMHRYHIYTNANTLLRDALMRI